MRSSFDEITESVALMTHHAPILMIEDDASKAERPAVARAVCIEGCLTMTYFRTGNPYYHRRAAVSRSCSGWEGVVPAGYGRQALGRYQGSGNRDQGSATARHDMHAALLIPDT